MIFYFFYVTTEQNYDILFEYNKVIYFAKKYIYIYLFP